MVKFSPGDRITMFHTRGERTVPIWVGAIESLTKGGHYVVGGAKFRKSDGGQLGSGHYFIRAYTGGDEDRITEDARRAEARGLFNDRLRVFNHHAPDFLALSPERLTDISRVLFMLVVEVQAGG